MQRVVDDRSANLTQSSPRSESASFSPPPTHDTRRPSLLQRNRARHSCVVRKVLCIAMLQHAHHALSINQSTSIGESSESDEVPLLTPSVTPSTPSVFISEHHLPGGIRTNCFCIVWGNDLPAGVPSITANRCLLQN